MMESGLGTEMLLNAFTSALVITVVNASWQALQDIRRHLKLPENDAVGNIICRCCFCTEYDNITPLRSFSPVAVKKKKKKRKKAERMSTSL